MSLFLTGSLHPQLCTLPLETPPESHVSFAPRTSRAISPRGVWVCRVVHAPGVCRVGSGVLWTVCVHGGTSQAGPETVYVDTKAQMFLCRNLHTFAKMYMHAPNTRCSFKTCMWNPSQRGGLGRGTRPAGTLGSALCTGHPRNAFVSGCPVRGGGRCRESLSSGSSLRVQPPRPAGHRHPNLAGQPDRERTRCFCPHPFCAEEPASRLVGGHRRAIPDIPTTL